MGIAVTPSLGPHPFLGKQIHPRARIILRRVLLEHYSQTRKPSCWTPHSTYMHAVYPRNHVYVDVEGGGDEMNEPLGSHRHVDAIGDASI